MPLRSFLAFAVTALLALDSSAQSPQVQQQAVHSATGSQSPGHDKEASSPQKLGDTSAAAKATNEESQDKQPQNTTRPNADASTPPGLWSGDVDEGEASEFIKGNLIHPGTRRLLSRYDHVGVAVGPRIINNNLYLNVTPGVGFYLDDFAFALGVPLNLALIRGGSLEYGGLRVRRQDWDEIADFTRMIRFFTIGRKEYNLYFTLNSLRPYSLGHGQLINQYQTDIAVNRNLTGFMFDAYNEYAGFQLQANDITFQNRILGGLAFVKPLSLFTDNTVAQSFSLGVEYAADLRAPRCIRRSLDSQNCVRGTGHAAGNNPYTGESLDQTFVRSRPDTGRFAVEETVVHAIGPSVELKIYKDERNVDIKTYGTYHRFLNQGGGDGAAFGLLGRFNVGTSWRHAFRTRLEYRNFGDGFLPNYFNSLYEVKKYGYNFANAANYQVAPTKYQAVFGDPENGFERPELGRRHGYNVEASWGLFRGGRSGKKVSAGFGLQDSTGPYDTQLYAHLEFPLLGFLQVFGTFMKANEESLAQAFGDNFFTSRNTIVQSGLRLQVLPILFINAHYSRNFQIVRSPGSEYHLGNDRIRDRRGNPSPFFTRDTLYENVQMLFVELELGWEFE